MLNKCLRNMLKKLRGKYQKEQQEFENITRLIKNAPVIIFSGKMYDYMPPKIDFVSGSLKKILGYERVAGFEEWKEMVHPDDRELLESGLVDFKKSGYVEREYRIKTNEGLVRWLYTETSKVSERDVGVVEFVGISVDITEIKEKEKRLWKTSKLATLGEIATAVAHELNQPLQVIQLSCDNALETLEKENDTDIHSDIKRRLTRIEQQAQRARNIVENMRRFGRSAPPQSGVIEVGGVVEAVEGLIGQQFRAHGITLEVVNEEGEVFVYGTKQDLEQVIINLLNNSKDAIEEARLRSPSEETGASNGYIKVTMRRQDTNCGGRIVLSVKDDGGGVKEECVPFVFESMFTTKIEGEGTGVGLAIVKQLVEGMGGEVRFKNIDNGAEFVIELPEERQAAASDCDDQ